MRRVPALAVTAVTAVLATAAVAGAAPARGVTFTDPAGDANGLDGRATAGSQAAYDITRVTLTPHARTARAAGLTIRLDLAAAPSTAPGSSYVFAARQDGCDLTVSRTMTSDGVTGSTLVNCAPGVGQLHSYTVTTGVVARGKSLTFTVPADALPNSAVGATLTGIEVGTTTGDQSSGVAAPARIDRATYAHPYRVGS